MKKKQNTYEPAFAEGQEPQPEKKPKRPRADAVFSATADTAPLPGTGTGAGSSRAGAPPRRKAYHGKLKAFLLLFSILMLAGLLGYCAMADNYKECFIPGTYINGIEATELTAEDIKARIKAEAEDYAITVTFRGTEPGSTVTEKIDAKDFGYHYISGKDVDDVFNAQDRYRWPLAYFGQNNNHTVGTDTDYEEEDLKAAFFNLNETKPEGQVLPSNAYISIDENSMFTIVPEVDGNCLKNEEAYQLLSAAVAGRAGSVDLTNAELYHAPDVRSDDPSLTDRVNEINSFLGTVIKLNLPDGSQRTIDQNFLKKCLVKNADGSYEISDSEVWDEVRAYVADLGIDINTASKGRPFTSTLRGTVYIKMKEQVGVLMDQEATTASIATAIINRQSQDINLSYSVFSEASNIADSGTYVEVDKINQRVFVYVNHQQVLDTPCVTGQVTDPVTDTPEGLFSIIDMRKGIHLLSYYSSGEILYDSEVEYWMQFTYDADGFHDASWRTKFGGDDYKYIGSHGCVNLPRDAAAKMYSCVYLGMPVVVFS